MEQRIVSLATCNTERDAATSTDATVQPMSDPPSSIEVASSVKPEASMGHPPSHGPETLLRDEILRLRSRCAEAEEALRAMRDSSRSFEDIVAALGLAGKSITERADRVLESSFGNNEA